MRWLAQREHSRAELARKLAQCVARRDGSAAEAGRRGNGWRHAVGGDLGNDLDDDLGCDFGEVESGGAAARIAAVLDELSAIGLLSDERAAASVLAAQAPRGGERRLRHALQQRGLDPELVERTLAQARPGEFERARALWRRRFGAPPADPAERARQMRFLTGRGFDGDVVRCVLSGSGDGADEE